MVCFCLEKVQAIIFLIFVVFIFNLFLLLKIFNEKRFNSIYKFWLNDTFNVTDIEKPLVIRMTFQRVVLLLEL